jgi:aminopeptidase N
MLDPDTGSEEYFDGFMQGLFTRFKDRTISTEEFQHFLETWVQADMQWFFDQWVYGTGIPTYRFAWTTEEVADGQVKMTVRIRQEDVPEEFRMPVPILLDFGAEGTAVVPVLVTGREVVIDLPLLPRVPDDVTFNVLESVLAEVHTEGW